MRLLVTGIVATLSLLAVSVSRDADAAIDTHPMAAVVPANPLGPAIFDPAPKGFPSFSRFQPYEKEFAAIAPQPDIAPPPPLPVLGNLPPLKLLDLAPLDGAHAKAVPEKAVPEEAQSDKRQVKKEASLTSEEVEPAPTVDVPALPPRRPHEADRRVVPSGLEQIAFAGFTLPPMGHTLFCLKYPADCQEQNASLHTGPIALTAERQTELMRVNADVNSAIEPRNMHESPAAEKWLISPKFGDCNDYAVTKRHELLALGWPSRDLLLAEVVTTWGEHHLVLIVRTDKGDVVADSLDKKIRNWAQTPYRWVRVETPDNPKFWAMIQTPQPDLVAMARHDNRL